MRGLPNVISHASRPGRLPALVANFFFSCQFHSAVVLHWGSIFFGVKASAVAARVGAERETIGVGK